MLTESSPTIDQETLTGIVLFVWQTLLDQELVIAAPEQIDDAYYASISIGGDWPATLVVGIEAGLARTYAAELMGMSLDELEEIDVDDAIGELANVVGGNVKGVVEHDGTTTLSLPVVSRSRPVVTGGHLTVVCPFTTGSEPVIWELYERL